jgi:hypothetical protein
MPVVRSVLAELESTANPAAVYRTVQQWVSAVENTGVRDIETIDAELRLIVRAWRAARVS